MLSEDDEKNLTGLLAAVRHPPMPFADKVSVADTFRRWIYLIVVGIIGVVLLVIQVQVNSKLLHEIVPIVRVMNWMKDNGYTNREVAPFGPIKPPKYDD